MERIKFDIPIWDEPHQDKFEKGITHPAIYVGDRFVLVAVRKKDDLVQEPLAEYSKTDKEKGDIKFFVDDDSACGDNFFATSLLLRSFSELVAFKRISSRRRLSTC